MSAERYTDDEHMASLDKWMAATDRERSEAFYTLLSSCGARAATGDDTLALRLRSIVAMLQAGDLR